MYSPSTGHIEVKRKGYYYIYSQMYYYDGTTILMGHNTYINHEKVMTSLGGVISAERKYNTKYHGGVFLLQEDDVVSVKVPFAGRFSMDRRSTFFGAFLLKDAEIQGKQMSFSSSIVIMTEHNIIDIIKHAIAQLALKLIYLVISLELFICLLYRLFTALCFLVF